MAVDTKVTDFPELAVAADADDWLYIVDRDDITDDPAGSSKKIQISNVRSAGVPETRTLYVGKHGNDSNDGDNIAGALLTFGAAITAATALTPTQAAPVAINCADSGIYVENIVVPSWVSIIAEQARIDSPGGGNTIMVDEGAYVRFKEIRQEAGSPAAVVRLNTSGKAHVEADDIICAGTSIGIINFAITATVGVLFARVGSIFVESGFAIGDASNEGHMHVEVGDIYITGNNGVGISRGGAGSTICRVEHILELGTPTGTIAINVGATGEIEIFVGTIVADTAWSVAAGGELNVFVASRTGALVETGTVNAVEASEIETHLNDATIHFTEASIDHTAITNIGANSHAAIDTHIADGTIHFTEASIDHTAIANIGANTHAQIDTHIASAANPHTVTLQQAYDGAVAVPQVTVNATPAALTIDASVAGDIFAVRDSSNSDRLRVSDTALSLGRAGRRNIEITYPDATGRIGNELWPDDFTISTATGNNAAWFTDAARTITLNIPGGGGLGNDTAPSGMNFAHTVRFEDTGFLFAAQLLINAAVQVECATNTVGPLYLFLDQYRTYADGGARTCSQHNAMRAQPSWGPNVSGGSITQTSCQLFFATVTVDATVGSASITSCDYFVANSPTLTAGGTIGTFNAFNILDITGPTTIRGINSAMNNGTFINHTGTAPSTFAGNVVLNARVDINNGIALGGGAAATLGTIGGSGLTAAAQAQWVEIDVNGVAHWIPVWT